MYGVNPIATSDAVSRTPPDTVESTSPKPVPSNSLTIASAGMPDTGIAERILYIINISVEKTIFFRISFVLNIDLSLSIVFFIRF